MKLYHGTSIAVARRAVVDGLKPRKMTKAGNWDKSPSHPGAVYLTDAYPLYFGVQALETTYYKVPEGDGRHVAAVVEVDASRLSPFDLVPDEDVLEQVGRKHDDLPKGWTMRQRTTYYRNRLASDYRNGEGWLKSLEAMGTCAHLGVIPASAITRVAFVDNRVPAGAHLMWIALDASISLINYRFMATKYRELTAKVFAGGAGVEIQEVNP
jgi:hypothetical protein